MIRYLYLLCWFFNKTHNKKLFETSWTAEQRTAFPPTNLHESWVHANSTEWRCLFFFFSPSVWWVHVPGYVFPFPSTSYIFLRHISQSFSLNRYKNWTKTKLRGENVSSAKKIYLTHFWVPECSLRLCRWCFFSEMCFQVTDEGIMDFSFSSQEQNTISRYKNISTPGDPAATVPPYFFKKIFWLQDF